jgi:hypothetical protein
MSGAVGGESLYYVGDVAYSILGNDPRYLYALRREEDGTLYLNRFDQIGAETWVVNTPGGDPAEDYNDFTFNVDFLDGRNPDKTIEYDNLIYEQWRFDPRFVAYYINEDGYLVARVGRDFDYPANLLELDYVG